MIICILQHMVLTFNDGCRIWRDSEIANLNEGLQDYVLLAAYGSYFQVLLYNIHSSCPCKSSHISGPLESNSS